MIWHTKRNVVFNWILVVICCFFLISANLEELSLLISMKRSFVGLGKRFVYMALSLEKLPTVYYRMILW